MKVRIDKAILLRTLPMLYRIPIPYNTRTANGTICVTVHEVLTNAIGKHRGLWIPEQNLKMAVKMDTAKFDDVLMGILQHCEQVQPFLDSIFSFLARRTDFFQVMRHRDDKMGFPPGVAEKIVLKVRLFFLANKPNTMVRLYEAYFPSKGFVC